MRGGSAALSTCVVLFLISKTGSALSTQEKSSNDPIRSFSKELFDAALPLANAAFNSCFIRGIRQGDLDPREYGAYTVQDSIYMYNATGNLAILENRATALGLSELAEFAKKRGQDYLEYYAPMFRSWHIGNADAIEIGEQASLYLSFHGRVLFTFPPYYVVIAMLPCDMLWEWLGKELSPYATSDNLYAFWIRFNDVFDRDWENFVDAHSDAFDGDIAKRLFEIAMVHEINFFRSVCKEDPMPVPSLPEAPVGHFPGGYGNRPV